MSEWETHFVILNHWDLGTVCYHTWSILTDTDRYYCYSNVIPRETEGQMNQKNNLLKHTGLVSLGNVFLFNTWSLGFLVFQIVKNRPTMQEAQVWSLGWEDPLEKEMANHSGILAQRIPCTEEPGRPQPMGHRVRHNWVTNTHRHTHTGFKTQRKFISWFLKDFLSWIQVIFCQTDKW